jgi:hypothetical protein
MSNQPHNLSSGAFDLFMTYARDAGNWSGTPLVGGNINQDKVKNGYLTDLKKKGLLTTFDDGGCAFIDFTEEGQALAAANGSEII